MGSTQPIYTFEELFKDMQTGLRRIRSEESIENPNNKQKERKVGAIDIADVVTPCHVDTPVIPSVVGRN